MERYLKGCRVVEYVKVKIKISKSVSAITHSKKQKHKY